MPARHWVWSEPLRDGRWAEAWGQEGMEAGAYQRVLRGEPIGDPPPKIRLTKLQSPLGHPLSDYAITPLTLVVSQRLADVLEASGAQFELIPVRVERKRAKYFLANVLESVACLDEERTEWMTRSASRLARKPVLKPIPAGAPPIFRVAESLLVLVRNELRVAMQEACSEPGRFHEP